MGIENKIFCPAPFAALRIETSKLGVTYKPGCVYSPVNKISSLDEFLHGPEMTAHRDNLCNGTTSSLGCHRCRESEKLGLTSTRLYLRKRMPLHDNVVIKLLDIMYSNTCNLSCFMCNPDSSSSVSSERYTLGFISKPVPYFDNTEYAIEAMNNLPNLEKVDLIGGEFFLFKNNSVILDKVIERKLACRIVTNGTILTDSIIQRLEQIKDLELEFSVDGIESCYEFMRYPANWETTSSNIKTLQQHLPLAKMKFAMVVQPLNIQHIIDSLEVMNTFKMITHFQDLSTPEHLSWAILTDTEKNDLKEYLLTRLPNSKITNKQKQEIEGIVAGVMTATFNPQLRDKAINFLGKTLKHRNIKPAIITTQFGIFKDFATQLIKETNATICANRT